ncbi:hypothetical protein E3N88_21915 [Mikania micrantha]|uniref:Receptor ligand binding region domain-containing protein n=1 Tax=Mikania micrantha TaxID=192012 RepID=A0A5N6N9A9_9ASTR|nr:hypothetical protein E3N88_21915 [Mikania micrantha]
MLQDKWFGKKSDSKSTPGRNILNVKALRGLFLISGVSMAAALFLFTLNAGWRKASIYLEISFPKSTHPKTQTDPPYFEVPVGLILDMGSRVGTTIMSCISVAVSEFYADKSHYKTKIVLHNRDIHGEPLHALSSGKSNFSLSYLVPILSFSPIPSSNRHPYFLQITQDETAQVKAISSMALSYGWKDVMVIFEDTENGRDMAIFIVGIDPLFSHTQH